MMKKALIAMTLTLASGASVAQMASDSRSREIDALILHPVFAEPYACSEHAAWTVQYLGDDLGQDCVIESLVVSEQRMFMRSFRTDGLANEDWFGWDKPVLAPCDCSVVSVSINDVTNRPGELGEPPASMIRLALPDGTNVAIAHIKDPTVKAGDSVRAGQQIARVGNNGYSRSPHIHVGAWRGNDALQIRWDSKAIPVP